MLKSPAPLCKALLLSISLFLLIAGPLAAQNTPRATAAVAKRHAPKVAKRRVVRVARQRAHHARAVRIRRVEVHERLVRIHVRHIAWAHRHRRTVIVWPSHPGQIWAVARLPGYENRVRVRPNRWARIIEKIRHGTRFRVVGKVRDPFGTLYYRVALRDGRIGWLNRICVRFLR